MVMTRRDYEVIAEIIAELNWKPQYTPSMVYEVAETFAYKLKADNHKFNEKIFLDYVKERM